MYSKLTLFVLGVCCLWFTSCSDDEGRNADGNLVVNKDGALAISFEQLNSIWGDILSNRPSRFTDYELVKHLTVTGTVEGYGFSKEILEKFCNIESLTYLNQDVIDNGLTIKRISSGSMTEVEMSIFPKLKELYLPEVTEIGNWAFAYAEKLEKVVSPKLKIADSEVFSQCTALKEISLPELEDNGSGGLFSGCTALVKADLPKLKNIGTATFGGCKALSEIVLPSADVAGSYAFESCSAKKVIAKQLTQIERYAFKQSGIIEADFPNVKYIGELAFIDCVNLKRINLPAMDSITTLQINCPSISCLKLSSARYIDYPLCDGVDSLMLGFPGDIEVEIKAYYPDDLSENCNLFLNENEYNQADRNNHIWKGKKWKSIQRYEE